MEKKRNFYVCLQTVWLPAESNHFLLAFGKGVMLSMSAEKQSNADLKEMVQELYGNRELYALLSPDKTNWMDGISILYVGNSEKKGYRIMFLFSTLDRAEKCARKFQFEKVEGMYPIAKLNSYEAQSKIDVLCSNAWLMGVNKICFDAGDPQREFMCNLDYFMQENKISKHAAYLASEESKDTVLSNESYKMPIRFSPLHICNFIPPEKIANERAEQLISHLFQDKDAGMQYYIANTDLTEMCFLVNYVRDGLIRQAKEQDKPEDAAWFHNIVKSLYAVLYIQMKQCESLYTIRERSDGGPHTKDGCIYLLYSNRCKNGLHPDVSCEKISSLDVCIRDAGEADFLITDKIHDEVLVPSAVFKTLAGFISK